MKSVSLSTEDATQVSAILRTHAFMQDMRAIEPMELIASMKKKGDDDSLSLIPDLQSQVDDMENDSDNLNRLADLIEHSK